MNSSMSVRRYVLMKQFMCDTLNFGFPFQFRVFEMCDHFCESSE